MTAGKKKKPDAAFADFMARAYVMEIDASERYADFADQMENIMLPALKAGFIVLADRYIHTLMARDLVRGMDEAWLKNLYGIALEPDAVF